MSADLQSGDIVMSRLHRISQHVSAGLSIAAVIISVVYPGYILLTTPGDAMSVYREYYQSNRDELPKLATQIGGVPKSLLVALWLLIVAGQIYATFRFDPRLWLALIQIFVAAGSVLYAWLMHLALVHFPMIKLFNDFSEYWQEAH